MGEVDLDGRMGEYRSLWDPFKEAEAVVGIAKYVLEVEHRLLEGRLGFTAVCSALHLDFVQVLHSPYDSVKVPLGDCIGETGD